MEIINYVGFNGTVRPKWKRVRERESFKKTSRVRSNRGPKLLETFGKAFDMLLSHPIEFIAFVLSPLCVFYLFHYFSSHITFSSRLRDVIEFDHSNSLDATNLSSVMETFALNESETFRDDGYIDTDSADIVKSSTFTSPVAFSTYKVREGDTISKITKQFGLHNISTLIGVNDIDNVRSLCAGQKLKIPSIDGLFFTVERGTTLAGLSAKYSVSLEELVDVNDLESEVLSVGQKLFIPRATMRKEDLQNALGTLFRSPLPKNYRISSMFGKRVDPISGVNSYHTGIDMAISSGTPIKAACSGRVSFAGYSNIFGNYVIINHSSGYQTLYGHMLKILAKKGQWVSQGTRIGLVGSTGYSTGPHLHFTVYKDGKLVDPLTILK